MNLALYIMSTIGVLSSVKFIYDLMKVPAVPKTVNVKAHNVIEIDSEFRKDFLKQVVAAKSKKLNKAQTSVSALVNESSLKEFDIACKSLKITRSHAIRAAIDIVANKGLTK